MACNYSHRHSNLVSKQVANSSPHDPLPEYGELRRKLRKIGENNTPVVFLAGERGTGKTTLAGFYLIYRLWRGGSFISGFYEDAAVIAYAAVDKMKSGQLSKYFTELSGYDTLVLDEVAQLHTPFSREFLFEVVNHRLNRNKATLLIAPFTRAQQIQRWINPSLMRRVMTEGVILRCKWKPLYGINTVI